MSKALLAAATLVAALAVAAPLPAAEDNVYTASPLVSDQFAIGANPADPTLVNAWGLAAGLRPTGSTPWWVADNGTDASTLYTGTGAKVPLTVGVEGGPTGIAFNGSTAFPVAGSASFFDFVNEAGEVLAWKPGLASAQVVATGAPGAIYKGLTFANTPNGPRLYAADFHNGHVD